MLSQAAGLPRLLLLCREKQEGVLCPAQLFRGQHWKPSRKALPLLGFVVGQSQEQLLHGLAQGGERAEGGLPGAAMACAAPKHVRRRRLVWGLQKAPPQLPQPTGTGRHMLMVVAALSCSAEEGGSKGELQLPLVCCMPRFPLLQSR